ncbi:YchJ family protein [Microbacterium murale]|uniref:YchJ family protein n=1 Tax=Microbacterium murale TaxID=1081040 RepID=UPI001667679A|nr:YchJ family metal-binding protein [Microbacterium murale]
MRCPCLSGDTFESCCGPVLAGEATAPTAERLMRSRFTAFAVGDSPYLLRSWHPSTRPGDLELDTDIRWTRLDILETEAGGPFDTSGFVAFEAFYRERGVQASLKERSRFVREVGIWSYVDGAPVG